MNDYIKDKDLHDEQNAELEQFIKHYEQFTRNRITSLRMKRNISETQMGLELGHSRGYVHNYSSGTALPTLKSLFNICEYFAITPSEFFDEESKHPDLVQQAVDGLKKLDEADMKMIIDYINRLQK